MTVINPTDPEKVVELERDGLVRSDHGDSSHAAAKAIAVHAGSLRAAVLWQLRLRGPQIAEEIEKRCALAGNTVRPRLVELHRGELIRKTGNTRPTTSGRKADLWELTKAGRDVLDELDAR